MFKKRIPHIKIMIAVLVTVSLACTCGNLPFVGGNGEEPLIEFNDLEMPEAAPDVQQFEMVTLRQWAFDAIATSSYTSARYGHVCTSQQIVERDIEQHRNSERAKQEHERTNEQKQTSGLMNI